MIALDRIFQHNARPFMFCLPGVRMSNSEFPTPADKASYGIGYQMGEQIKNTFSTVSLKAAIAGFEDAFNGVAERISNEDLNEAFVIIQQQIQDEEKQKSAKFAAEGEAFLAENAKRDDIIVTESGLQYQIITQGDGAIPTSRSTVRTHYRGTLINGKEFDSSYRRNEPAEFPVSGVIAGWTEALQKMTVGSVWKLFIPYHLAYGERGAGNDIGPYQALIFDIELLDIVQ
jgi:FKBP-type peptidyl-prolyl cis-trans isomerase FklB